MPESVRKARAVGWARCPPSVRRNLSISRTFLADDLKTGVHVIDNKDDLYRGLPRAEGAEGVMVCGTLLSRTMKSCC
jgi:hypothetical protein